MENEDDFIKSTMTWSYSRLSSFGQCPLEWKNKYIDCCDTIGSCYAQFGTICHEILEKFFKGELTEFDLAPYYEEHYADYVTLDFPAKTGDTLYEKGLRYFENFTFDFNKYEVLGVEKEVKFTINGHDCVGYIDLLLRDKTDGKIIIADHKSGSIKLKKDGGISKTDIEHFEGFKRQLYLYAIQVIQDYGSVKELKWNLFKDGNVITIPFSTEEFEQTKQWAEDRIKEIESTSDYPANSDYFYCQYLCASRQSVYCPYKRLGSIYTAIVAKCYNPKVEGYDTIGGIGVKMCDEWHEDPQKFYKWALDNSYADNLVLRRYDFTTDYTPDNCYWISEEEDDYSS